MSPKISVLMSVYNGLPYLQESVDSILNQTYKDLEFIIIDDCSTDNSWIVLSEYAKKDERIKLFKNEKNLGLTKSLNKGLKLAHGKYIARQDADDISFPQRFEKQVKYLEDSPDIVLVSGKIETINSEGISLSLGKTSKQNSSKVIEPILIDWYLLFRNYIGGHSQVMYKREEVLKLGGYSEHYRYAQDYELWCRMVDIGKIVILPKVLLKYRVHNKSIGTTKLSKQSEAELLISRYQINNLTNKELTMTEILNLKSFWLIGLRNKSPKLNSDSEINFDSVHHNLRLIYKAFIEKNKRNNSSKFYPETEKKISNIISQCFYDWASIFKSTNKIKALNLLLYAFMWDSKKILSLIFKKFI